MGYAETSAPPNKLKDVNTVTSRLESLLGRLDKVGHKLFITADRILGPSPSPTGESTSGTEGGIRQGIDRAHELVTIIECQLDRLGDGL